MSKTEVHAKLYPERSVYEVLGNLCKDPSLLRDSDINLNNKDFYKEIHRIAYAAINNITLLSPERDSVSPIEIDNYLSETPAAYKKWTDYKGYEFIEKSIQHSEKNSFKINYDRVKKFSLLRASIDRGIDIRDIYNYDTSNLEDLDTSMRIIDEVSTQDIINHMSLKIMDLKEDYVDSEDTLTYHMGDDIGDLIERLRSEPMYGYPFANKFYNTFFRGMMGGKLMLRSADSGQGKTRNNLKDLAYITMDRLWCHDKKTFVENPFTMPGLYIGTEEHKLQTQTVMISIVSGIEESILKNGLLTPDLLERLEIAQEIIENSKLYAHRDDDFSVKDIEMVIEKFIIEKNVFAVVFDYIQITPKISRTATQEFGGAQKRDDQILEYFSSQLKEIAERYDIFMMSATQLNRSHKSREMRDSAALAGGSATARKVDFGVQLYKPTHEDFKELDHILSTGKYERPNYSHWVYKNRSEPYDRHIIWTKIEMGSMEERELFVTDYDYQLIDVPLTTIDLVKGKKDITTENVVDIEPVLEVDNTNPFM